MASNTSKLTYESQAISAERGDSSRYDVFMMRQAIRRSYEDICKYYNPEYNKTLFSEKIIPPKTYENLKRICERHGPTEQCEHLLDYILVETNVDQLAAFIDVIKRKQHDLYKIIEKFLDGNGSIKHFLQEIKKQLQRVYAEKKYHHIESLPGETFILNLKNKRFLMPLDFSTEVRTRDSQADHMKDNIYNYKSQNYSSIEEILGSLLMDTKTTVEEDGDTVVLVTGDAGSGKTVLIHKIICQWMDGNDPYLNQYDIVLAIPLRNVNTEESLSIILSDAQPKYKGAKGGLNYIKDGNMLATLDDYLKDGTLADKKVLCMIDGVDEVDLKEGSELFKLTTGNCFPNVNVLVTVRPKAQLFQKLVDCWPKFKVFIHGTTEAGVYHYLKEMMTKERGTTEEEINALITRMQMGNFELLKVPLYVTLLGVMCIEHWAKYANFINFKVPATTTGLFNSFINILLHRWIKRDPRYDNIKQVKFGRHPYDETNIPKEILTKLHIFANLSYLFLKEQKYDFTTQNLSKYHIDINDVIHSGMFCHSSSNYFYKHKMLQEFMAALYLVHPLCLETFNAPTETDTLENILLGSKMFLGIINLAIFVFGMSPQHALDIVGKLEGKIKQTVGETWLYRLNGLDIDLLLGLWKESDNKKVTKAMTKSLSQSQTSFANPERFYNTGICQHERFFSSLKKGQAVSLLDSWYNINIYPIKEGWGVVNSHNSKTEINDVKYDSIKRSFQIKCLDITLLFLLKKFILPQVDSLFIDSTLENVPDIVTIGTIFPNITKLFVAYTKEETYDETLLNIAEISTFKLSGLQHISHWDIKYSSHSQQLLLEQSKLQTICINAAIIHGIGDSKQPPPYWPKLDTLKLYIQELISEKQDECSNPGVCDVRDLCHLLRGVPHITTLSLCRYDSEFPSERTITTLLECIRVHTTNLNTLHICDMLDSHTLPKLFPIISGMALLKHLGIDDTCIDRHIKMVVDELSTVDNTLTKLEILSNYETGIAQNTKEKLLEYMETHYPDMSIKVSSIERHATYLQPELPDPISFKEFI